MFVKAVLHKNKIPFEIENEDPFYSEANINELKRRIKNAKALNINNLYFHLQERIKERGLKIEEIEDTINNPLVIKPVREDDTYQVIGKKTTIGVSASDGTITTAWRISEKIAAVRKHIFEDDKHLFEDGSIGKFSESADISLAWQRLEQNKATKNDILLLNHEYVELLFMNKKGYYYHKAHLLSDLRYPWDLKTDKRYKELNDVKIHEIVRKCLKDYL